MNYFATEYTIHFDDTMAYGSHHFLTSFKFQCAAREAFLFGEKIYDVAGVQQALDRIHLLTADAYARNLHAARLGERLAILLTIEEWHRASARFCYRVIRADGQPICAGFQTLIGVDSTSGSPIPLPDPLWNAMESMRAIEEPISENSFRKRVLAGGAAVEELFGKCERETAIAFLRERYPSPQLIAPEPNKSVMTTPGDAKIHTAGNSRQVWVFAGQGALDLSLLCQRVVAYRNLHPAAGDELEACARIVKQLIGGDPDALFSGSELGCRNAIKQTPLLSQIAIHLQNVLGVKSSERKGDDADIFMGHSFGEIAAFEIAGCFDLLTGIQIVCERVRAISEHAPSDGDLLVVSEDRWRVATELGFSQVDQVVVAGRNHNRQTVLSGPQDQLRKLADYLRQRDIQCVPVATPTSFHHPRLRGAAQQWMKQIQKLELKAPNRLLYSPNGRRFIASTDDIATTLSHQLLRPFDLKGAVDDLSNMGATRFVDCGSNGSLAKLLSKSGAVVSQLPAIQGPTSLPKFNDSRYPFDSESKANLNGRHPQVNGHKPAVENLDRPETKRKLAIPIAIVGQGCLLPGDANSPEELHRAIFEQRNGIVDQRLFDSNWAEDFYSASLQSDRSTSFLTGRVNDRLIVCPAGVDPDAFDRFTRTQRLLCIALAPCIESLRGARKIMCFMGATADGFEDHDLVTSLEYSGIDPRDAEVDRRLHTKISAGRGPHASLREVMDVLVRPGIKLIMVDAACASSLYAAALGMLALETDRADAVIAGGVFCPGPGNSCLFSQFNGTTSTGCRPFDAGSDGVVFSEGAAVVTLRRLEDAVELNCPIMGLLRGFGLSSDGRSSSANVPQSNGQLLSLERCYSHFGLDRSSIDAIEAHGTSTPVGDATELKTLSRFYENCVDREIPVHSLKGLLGHAGWAAGTASLIAACQYLKHGVFPAQANFHNPCEALLGSETPLKVPKFMQPLPSRARVAVDGFGFGGANAHMVIEKYEDSLTVEELSVGDFEGDHSTAVTSTLASDDELVIVACHQLEPEQGNQFDRNHMLSDKHILLPDLVDDMDISQSLAVSLADGLLTKLPSLDSKMRESTGMVLALSGKTERGVEATARILTPRLKRQLAGHTDSLEKLDEVMDRSRPSGPYTLQCMMPNVASGRAVLQMDLKGPNFVVDAGKQSLKAAFDSASLLLGSRKRHDQLYIVAAIKANHQNAGEMLSDGEYAAAFLVATRRLATELGLNTISTIDQIQECLNGDEESNADQIRQIIEKLHPERKAPANSGTTSHTASRLEQSPSVDSIAHTIHTPVWVESELEESVSRNSEFPSKVVVVVSQAAHADAWIEELERRDSEFKLVIAQAETSQSISPSIKHLCFVDCNQPRSIQKCLEAVDAFDADIVIGFDSPSSWNVENSLKVVASHPLGELMFLLAQHLESRIRLGKVELWGLFLDSYRDLTHPLTGSTAGLLKSIRRELKSLKVGIAYSRDLTLSQALDRLNEERCGPSDEAEVVFDGPLRLVSRLQAVSPIEVADSHRRLGRESVVVATGGAQGVTAVLMESLLKKYQCTVVAIGRSHPEAGPLGKKDCERVFYEDYVRQNPKVDGAEMKRAFHQARRSWETHATIQRLQSLGGHFEYLSADVTQANQVEVAIREIVFKYGKIDLLVHGAGIQYSKQLKDRTHDEFRKTFAVKVGGLENLVHSCRRELGCMPTVHALTSAYSIFGNDGQHDYGAANETLNRLCNLGSNQKHNWSSIAWLAWDGIGMTRGSEYQALAQHRGLSCLTPETGSPFFHEVLEGQSAAAVNVPLSDQERLTYGVETIPASSGQPVQQILESRFHVNKIEWLNCHLVRDVPTVPGAWILDRMVKTALKMAPKSAEIRAVTIEDISFRRFIRPLEYHEFSPRVIAMVQAEGVAVWILGDIRHRNGTLLKKDIVLAQARFRFHDVMDCATELVKFSSNSYTQNFLRDPYCSADAGRVNLSGPFECLQDIQIHRSGRQARFVMHDGNGNPQPTQTPALLLDATWRVGAMYAHPNSHELYVPVQIQRITLPVDPVNRKEPLNDCFILSTPPEIKQDFANWKRSEVHDSRGRLQLVVENAMAAKMT